jgi:high-affinity iron transporter
MAVLHFTKPGLLVATLACALACAREPAEAPATPTVDGGAVAASNAERSGAVVSGNTAPASGGFPAVVTLEAAAGDSGRSEAIPPPVFMDQITGAFYPPTLLARVGQTVEFFNSEGVMHTVNVASDSTGATVLNIATPPGFESYPHVFDVPGVYRVTCDIHPSMSAFIVAVEAPYATVADRDGRFELAGVAPGSYRASVWSLDASSQVSRSVEIGSGEASVELDLQPGAVAE